VLSASADRVVSEGPLLTFSDGDAISALEIIVQKRPQLIVLERLFASTPRGVALLNRIKSDPTLIAAEIRIVSHDSDDLRIARPGTAHVGAVSTVRPSVVAPAAVLAALPATPALDQRGTRRAPRFRIPGDQPILVDGNHALIIDLSRIGAQVVCHSNLKPNQRVRLLLSDEVGALRFNGAIAWASFEIPPNLGPRYRAGIEFLGADADAVEAYYARHK
jgi:hypothetical protein